MFVPKYICIKKQQISTKNCPLKYNSTGLDNYF